jgi:thiol-disulfide isomerase/thioredoxin
MIIIILIIILLIYYFYNIFYENFNVEQNKTKVIYYYTPWCGWSNKFKPEWDKFIKIKNKNIETLSINCDDNNSQCSNIPGFPYIVIEKNNKIISYDGKRTANDLFNHIKKL